MPKSCVVPGCKSNYYGGEYIPVFSFPTATERRELWIKKIPRENLTITKNSGVCIKHFPDEKILKEIRGTRPDGKLQYLSLLLLANFTGIKQYHIPLILLFCVYKFSNIK